MRTINNNLVSVIIPVYNCDAYLEQAVTSVLSQTYKNFEIIIVDDGSTDNSAKVAKQFGDSVIYEFQENRGPAAARNRGLELAKGDYIAFLDADDFWTSDKLQIQVSYLDEHPEVEYTIAKVKYFLEQGHPIPPGLKKTLLEGDHVGTLLTTLVARKNLFERIGNFKPEFGSADDTEWFARCIDAHIPMAIMPQILLHKRTHSNNISLNENKSNNYLLNILRQSIHRKRQVKNEL